MQRTLLLPLIALCTLLVLPARAQSLEPPPTYGLTMTRLPLFVAVCKGQTEEVRKLLDKGSDPNYSGTDGETPLGDAVSHGHIDIVRLLIERGAKVNQGDMWGLTPLFRAAAGGRITIVKILLEHDANVEPKTAFGNTPLMSAAGRGRTEIAQLLIAKGAQVNNAQTRNKMTALLLAVNGEHLSTARLLLENKADIHAGSSDGKNVLYLARQKKNKAMIALLKEFGAKE